jgi:hypothetical protein
MLKTVNPYASDGIHLVTDGYRQLGAKYGQVFKARPNWCAAFEMEVQF